MSMKLVLDEELFAACVEATTCGDAYIAAIEAGADQLETDDLWARERSAFARAAGIPARTVAGLREKTVLADRWQDQIESLVMIFAIAKDALAIGVAGVEMDRMQT
jgi:hypothetical protein